MSGLITIENFLANLSMPAHCRLDGDDAGRDQLGVLAVAGPDAGKFLQGQLTCDVLALAPGQHSLGACCTPQGRMRALFRLLRRDEDFLLLMPRAVVPLLLDALKKYAVFFKAQLRDASPDFQIWGLLGGTVPAATAVTELELEGPIPRRLLLAATSAVLPPLPGGSVAASHWATAEMLVGEATVYPETVEKLLPHHVNLPAVGGVSFSKGCYTGQEIVARMEYRGKIKTHLQLAGTGFTGLVPPGCPVSAGEREVGEVVRSAPNTGGQLLLLSLRDQAVAEPAQTEQLQLALPEAPILELHR